MSSSVKRTLIARKTIPRHPGSRLVSKSRSKRSQRDKTDQSKTRSGGSKRNRRVPTSTRQISDSEDDESAFESDKRGGKRQRKTKTKRKGERKGKGGKKRRRPDDISSTSALSRKRFKVGEIVPLDRDIDSDFRDSSVEFTDNYKPPKKPRGKEFKVKFEHNKYQLYCFCRARMMGFRRDTDEVHCDVCNVLIPFAHDMLSCIQGIIFVFVFLFVFLFVFVLVVII